jgi:UDPglucose 6-dehydrogenase
MDSRPTVGFVGQGFIGKNYADEFEERGLSVIRYSLAPEHSENKEKISDCDVVFVAVPTPTTPGGFDISAVKSALHLVGKGKIAVIKSTLVPGSTDSLQKEYPEVFVFHSPEFLRAKSAAFDSRNPDRNIIGMPIVSDEYDKKARIALSLMPQANYEKVCTAREAEIVKYFGNSFLLMKVVFVNLMSDLAKSLGADFGNIVEMVSNDPRIGASHMNVVDDKGRGAGGPCFIKDFEVLTRVYGDLVDDPLGKEILSALKRKNIDLLTSSNKDIDLLSGVYGENLGK